MDKQKFVEFVGSQPVNFDIVDDEFGTFYSVLKNKDRDIAGAVIANIRKDFSGIRLDRIPLKSLLADATTGSNDPESLQGDIVHILTNAVIRSAVVSLQALGSWRIHDLLKDLLGQADEQGIGRPVDENKALLLLDRLDEEITNIPVKKEKNIQMNDEYQIIDLVYKDVQALLGFPA